MTIDYTYDGLYRLVAADYSDGTYFHYSYDPVGNRLAQETLDGTKSYTYDLANRLVEVDGVAYLWDDNGNLLFDGEAFYQYDHANRLTSVNTQERGVGFVYNGLGDRLQQTVDGITTTYTLDLNTGLTQVLSDGDTAYLYGLARLAQESVGFAEYYLGDALGSVRQLVEGSGVVTYAASYAPYGEVLASAGERVSVYGFTGEAVDVTGLVYLRARYYSPWEGRFLTRDTWGGETRIPMSYNAWLYVYGNPLNAIDPSGYITIEESDRADEIVEELRVFYNVQIKKDWGYFHHFVGKGGVFGIESFRSCRWRNGDWRDIGELKSTYEAIKDMANVLGGPGLFRTAMQWRIVNIIRISSERIFKYGALTTIGEVIILPNNPFNAGLVWIRGTIVHELAHAWDYRRWGTLSSEMASLTKSFREVCSFGTRGVKSCHLVYDPTGEPPPTSYAQTNQSEDWADSFAIYIYPAFKSAGEKLGPIRRGFIDRVIADFPSYP